MTLQRFDNHSTEFGLWVRDVKSLESRRGYVASNVDFIWKNYKTGYWFFLEEKRYRSKLKFPQNKIFEAIDKSITCKLYLGFYFLSFSKTSPDDGQIFLSRINYYNNEIELTPVGLELFLGFDSYFFNKKQIKGQSKINKTNINNYIIKSLPLNIKSAA